MVDQAGAYAYNSWWQFRADSWSRLEEATGRIVTALRRTKPVDNSMTDAVHAQCAALAPLEQFWAFPGHAAFGVVQELAAAGAWERLGRLVARINRALVTESYRIGSFDDIAQGEHRDDRSSASVRRCTPGAGPEIGLFMTWSSWAAASRQPWRCDSTRISRHA